MKYLFRQEVNFRNFLRKTGVRNSIILSFLAVEFYCGHSEEPVIEPEVEVEVEVEVQESQTLSYYSYILASEPLGPEREPLQLRPEYHAGQNFSYQIRRDVQTIASVHLGDHLVATMFEDHARIECDITIIESEIYEPLAFSVTFTQNEEAETFGEQEALSFSGAQWDCHREQDSTLCLDSVSGAEFTPPFWLIFFHSSWITQETATFDLEWEDPRTELIGLETPVNGDVQFELQELNRETEQVLIRMEINGETDLSFYDNTTFWAVANGEISLDMRNRLLTSLSYELDTFVPPDPEGAASLQRRTHTTFHLQISMTP